METADARSDTRGALAARLVRGTLAQQGSMIVAVAAGLVATTALARSLTLSQFGVYGFVVTIASYLYFAIGTAEAAAVNEMAAAGDHRALEAAFTRSILIYAALGVFAGLLVAIGGSVLVSVVGFSPALTASARAGAAAVGVLTAVGWTAKVFQDYLRAIHRFTDASLCEAVGSALVAVAVVGALALDAPLWVLIAVGGTMPVFVGAAAATVVVLRGLRCRLSIRDVRAAELRSFLKFSSGMFVFSSSDLVISSLDRTVVAIFRSASTLGLYEAAARLNLLVRQLVANLAVTLVPVLSRMRATDDRDRERALVLWGTRYILVATVGPTVALMVLCDRVLALWLGQRFVAAAPAAVIFLANWLVAPNLSVASARIVVSRKLKQLTVYAWGVAAVNFVLSIALTAWLGLVGVAIGTTVGYLALVPYFATFAFSGTGVTAGELASHAWIPAYGGGVLLATVLLVIRLCIPLGHVWSLGVTGVTSVVAYWAGFLLFATDANERRMLRALFARGDRHDPNAPSVG
jgi:O-antigen/teichoic acid export membrane protein